MAGILDKKTRFMDTFLTQVGRSQLAHGELSFNFAVFSDSCTFYEPSQEDPKVVDPAENRIMFECANKPQDQVIPEFDDDGAISFPAGDFDIESGTLVLSSGSLGEQLVGAKLANSASAALSDCVESFKTMQPLRSEELGIGGKSGFKMSLSDHAIKVTSNTLGSGKPRTVHLKNLEPLWEDKKLTQVPNFQFLPPVSRVSGNAIKQFVQLEQPAPLSFTELTSNFSKQQKQPVTAHFTKTSLDNNIIIQVFEITSSSVEKLRMIDFGEFEDVDPTSNESLASPGKHCFFVGKLYDTAETYPTFVNIFTVVLD